MMVFPFGLSEVQLPRRRDAIHKSSSDVSDRYLPASAGRELKSQNDGVPRSNRGISDQANPAKIWIMLPSYAKSGFWFWQN